MATVITDECINCGACEPECPNVAIFQGGVEYEWKGSAQAALSDDFFFIVPDKCTECVGFFDQEACAAVCPVDCCIPDPARPEVEGALLDRAKQLHPDKEFGADFPSRFGGQGGQAGQASAPASGETAPPEATAAVAATAPVTAAPPTAAPSAVATAASAATSGGGSPARIERASRPPADLAAGDPMRRFDGELSEPFEALLDDVTRPSTPRGSKVAGLTLLFLSPILGALGNNAKRSIEKAFGNRSYFSSELSTALNLLLNFILYPVLMLAVAVSRGTTLFTEADRGPLILGILIATAEASWRLRDGFKAIEVPKMRLGASFYGAPLSLFIGPIVDRLVPTRTSGRVPLEGFYSGEFEAKRERQRRYGQVYQVNGTDKGFHINFELPRVVPNSGAKQELGVGDEMPDYDVNLGLEGDTLWVSGSVVDPKLRTLCGVSSAFPADFKTPITLAGPLAGFSHSYENKVLDIVVLRGGD